MDCHDIAKVNNGMLVMPTSISGITHYCIVLIYCRTDFSKWQVCLIVHLFPVFYTDITIPDLIKPLKCLAIKPVTLYIYKKA